MIVGLHLKVQDIWMTYCENDNFLHEQSVCILTKRFIINFAYIEAFSTGGLVFDQLGYIYASSHVRSPILTLGL